MKQEHTIMARQSFKVKLNCHLQGVFLPIIMADLPLFLAFSGTDSLVSIPLSSLHLLLGPASWVTTVGVTPRHACLSYLGSVMINSC